MCTTQIKIVQYIRSLYGGDIIGELETKTEFVTPSLNFPQSPASKQAWYKAMIQAQLNNDLANLEKKLTQVQAKLCAADTTDTTLVESLEEDESEITNKILHVEYNLNADVEVPLSEEEKAAWRHEQKTCRERDTRHLLNQQKAFAVIIGQCTQCLQDKLHDNSQWEIINRNQKPLKLYTLIERVVMQQMGDEYPASNLVDNLLAVLTLKQQNNQTNTQWYKKLNTRVDVAKSVGVEFTNFTSLWNYCCKARGWADYVMLTGAEQLTLCNDLKERMPGYLLIANSSSSANHKAIKNNLLEVFITKRNKYPATRSDAIALLNKYDKKELLQTGSSEGTAFAQKGKQQNGIKKKGSEEKKLSESKQSKK
jgi:hypothetical protein